MVSNDEDAMFMQTEGLSLRQLWGLTHVPFTMMGELSQQKDVKNEGRSDYMYENKGTEKMKKDRSGDVDENKQLNRKSGLSQNVIESKGDSHEVECWCHLEWDFFRKMGIPTAGAYVPTVLVGMNATQG
jgi:hypothetical protein